VNERKTKRVRIAVVMNRDGQWEARGHWLHDDEQSATQLHPSEHKRLTFVEADVPYPEVETVGGEATK